jgi:3-hydroxyisobutyrate dehydrogenase-like beta-hydroxyacid dehydrogenase
MEQNPGPTTTVAILYPGEMGSVLGKILRQAGLRVVTTLENRSQRTATACAEAGLEVLSSLTDIAGTANVVLSVVPPATAREVAERFVDCLPAVGPRPLYADLNSVSPETARAVALVLESAGVEFVDGAVYGLASRLPGGGMLYLSGPKASQLASILDPSLRVRVLGKEPGTASAFKMLIAGVNKGITALFLEMSLAARRAGLLDDFLATCKDVYPGVFSIVERLLPTCPRHAVRRGDEMRELAQMLAALGMRPCLVLGAQALHEEMGRLRLAEETQRAWTVSDVIEASATRGLLEMPNA